MPNGPIKTNNKKITSPFRSKVKNSMESLILKYYSEDFTVPQDKIYTATKVTVPKGKFGVYLISDGTNKPYRCKIKAP